MSPKCPFCGKYMMLIGDDPIGWDCETKENLPGAHINKWGEIFDGTASHYIIRGVRETVIIFPFKIDVWRWNGYLSGQCPDNSTVYRWDENKRSFESIFSCPALPIDNKDKLLARLKLLTVFS